MEGGTLAIAILIIVGFIVFIVWAKTASGQKSLRKTFGEPGGVKHRPRATKRSSGPAAKGTKTGNSSTR